MTYQGPAGDARAYYPGMGQAVADRTVNRPGETWKDVAARVAAGNASLDTFFDDTVELRNHMERATILMSGRHLQHGDNTQKFRNQEVFTNCSTAMTSATLFYLLLNGSGVGRSYDDAMMTVDWRNMPEVITVLSRHHKDWEKGWTTPEDAELVCEQLGRKVIRFRVPDSREGWSQAVEKLETLTWTGNFKDHSLILDFSDVRPEGSPIGGMQSRPASGPIPLMQALNRVHAVKIHEGWAPWRQAMQVDHELAECVLVGGARRSARIAVKHWMDPQILDYIKVKNQGGLWSANNSVGVDQDFWYLLKHDSPRAVRIFREICQQSYGNGEPGILNLHLLQAGEQRPTVDEIMDVGGKFEISDLARGMREELAHIIQKIPFWVIVNPCGEIRLSASGGYCVISDLAPHHTRDLADFKAAARLATRALIRTNLMDAFYAGEVQRTNRIGVGLTGVFEYALSHYGLSFRDLIEVHPSEVIIDANGVPMPAPTGKAYPFWRDLYEVAQEIENEAEDYSAELGVPTPLTRRTIKPAGTTSKLFGLTEGVHLPSMREYIRWVQFRNGDPLILEYEAKGYPVRRDLKTYPGTTIVGFPTRLEIFNLGQPHKIVTAAEATPAEQIRWLRLLETYWLCDVGGNQISYTLKYDPKAVSLKEFEGFMAEAMPLVRAVSVMPQADTSFYEYQPEEPIPAWRYDELMMSIEQTREDADKSHVECSNGFCPIDFNK